MENSIRARGVWDVSQVSATENSVREVRFEILSCSFAFLLRQRLAAIENARVRLRCVRTFAISIKFSNVLNFSSISQIQLSNR